MSWGREFARSRDRLMLTEEFGGLRSAGHQLKDGVVLTSLSDKPIEMSFKCTECGGVFWFRKVTDGLGAANWRFNPEFSATTTRACAMSGSAPIHRRSFLEEAAAQYQGSGEVRETVGRMAVRT